MFADYKGEVRARSRNRELSPQTIEIRKALVASMETNQFKVIPGTTEAEFKSWEGKLRTQAGQLDLGVKVRLTSDKGEVAFKAHELEAAPTSPPAPVVVPVTRASKPAAVAAGRKKATGVTASPPKRGPGRPRRNG